MRTDREVLPAFSECEGISSGEEFFEHDGRPGERCPVDPKHNASAWEKNRRVEFKIIETDAGPTGVEVTCPRGRSLVPR